MIQKQIKHDFKRSEESKRGTNITIPFYHLRRLIKSDEMTIVDKIKSTIYNSIQSLYFAIFACLAIGVSMYAMVCERGQKLV